MRPVVIYLFPNLRFLSITLNELLDPVAPIKAAVRTCSSLYGAPRLFIIDRKDNPLAAIQEAK